MNSDCKLDHARQANAKELAARSVWAISRWATLAWAACAITGCVVANADAGDGVSSGGTTTSGGAGGTGGTGGSGGSCEQKQGVYGDCLLDSGQATFEECQANPSEFCLTGPHDKSGVCAYACEDVCECPPAPAGFESALSCGELTGDGVKECHISCANGECPGDMVCIGFTVCHHGEPFSVGPYGDCTGGATCDVEAGGGCVVDSPMNPSFGFCAPPCATASECPQAPSTGTAVAACLDVLSSGDKLCLLECSQGESCPTGMRCEALDAVTHGCVW